MTRASRTHHVACADGPRILAVADLHLRQSRLDWLVRQAPGFDLVLVVGDVLDVTFGGTDHQIGDAVAFLRELRHQTCVAVSSGNHDLDRRMGSERVAEWNARLADLDIACDGDHVVIDAGGRTHAVTVCPWWDGPAGRRRLAEQIAVDDARRPDGRWIWMHHAPVAGSATAWDGRRDHGDDLLGGLVDHYRPDLVLSGHVHGAPFVAGGSWWDRYAGALLTNAGDAAGAVAPTHIVIDLAADVVEWRAPGYTAERCPIDPLRAFPTRAA